MKDVWPHRHEAIPAEGMLMTEQEISSDNLYADFGYEEPENMMIRAQLAMAIDVVIQEEGWSRKEAAERLRVTEARLSKILNGKLREISVDKLINMLAATGRHLEIRVGHAA